MRRSLKFLPVVLGMALLLAPAVSSAGDGEIVDGKLNLSVLFTYPESDPDSWRPLFEEANVLLHNATNGQLQLGRVRIVNCSFDKDNADIWVLDGFHGAFANVLGLSGEGHLYISQTHKSTTFPVLGQFGVVHELGHYAFGLYDEYKGEVVPAFLAQGNDPNVDLGEQTGDKMVPNQFCVTEDDPVTCLMDGGTTVTPNNGRTEFCTLTGGGLGSAHNDGVLIGDSVFVNAQQYVNEESCWETIASVVGLTPPDEVDTDPGSPDPIEWEVAPTFNRVVLCVDRSNSMGDDEGELGLAKQASNLFIEYLHEEKTVLVEGGEVTLPGERLGVVSFAHDSSVEFEMQEILGESTRDSAKAVVNEIYTNANAIHASAIGDGVQLSLDEIAAAGPAACSEAIVLLSDGLQNSGTDPLAVIPALQERGVRLYAVGLGLEADGELLEEMAEETGGQYYEALSEEELVEIMTEISAEVRAGGIITTFGDSIFVQDESIGTQIDALAEEVTVNAEYDPEDVLGMSLMSPSGEIITVEDAENREDVEAGEEDGFVFIRYFNPEEGEWTATLTVVQQDGPTWFNITFLEESAGVLVNATTDQEVYQFPDPVQLRVDVIADVPVANVDVTAMVERPGAGPIQLQVFDDGDPIHNDQWKDDGVYNTPFVNFTQDGEYIFHVIADNLDGEGTGPDPELPFVEDGADPPVEIPPFLRETTVSVFVEGVLGPVEADIDPSPPTINTASENGSFQLYIELPDPYSAADIDPASLLINGVLRPNSTAVGDEDEDGIPDMKLKNSRGQILSILSPGMDDEIYVTGQLESGEPIEGNATVSVIVPGEEELIVSPYYVAEHGTLRLTWEPADAVPVAYDGYVSVDGGMTWEPIFQGLSGAASFEWEVTAPPTTGAIVLVDAISPEVVVWQVLAEFDILASAGVEEPAIDRTAFRGVIPNPVSGTTTLRYALAAEAEVRLDIYDVNGRLVRRLASGTQPSGVHVATWDGTDGQGRQVSSGVYLYVFRAGSYEATGRVMMLR